MCNSRIMSLLSFALTFSIGAGFRQINKEANSDMLAGDFTADANALSETNETYGSSSPSYKIDMMRLKLNGYQKTFCGLSEDGCETLDGYPGPNAHNELTWAEVVRQLQTVPQKQDAGTIIRGNELGYLMLSDKLWERDVKTMGLGLSVDDHAWVRPMFDRVIGSSAEGDEEGKVWSAKKVKASLDEFLGDKKVLQSSSDVSGWATKLNHKFHFDMTLDDELVKKFSAFQGSAVPASLDLPGFVQDYALGIEAVQDERDEWLERYRKAIREDKRGLLTEANGADSEHMTLLASAFMDSLLFAGGLSVPGIILVGLAMLYSENSPMQGEHLHAGNAQQFAYEVLRRYPGVVGFPWWSPDHTRHSIMNIAMTLRDPRAWGEDSLEFKLRPLDTYKEFARVAWAEPANGPAAYAVPDPGRTGNLLPSSRGCPGQALSMVMLTEFFKAWSSKQNDYVVVEAPKGGITLSDATPFAPTITLAQEIKAGDVSKVTYSYLKDFFGSGSTSKPETIHLLAGDESRPAELHCSINGKFPRDDPSAREVVVLSEGTAVTTSEDSDETCFVVNSPTSGEHRFCGEKQNIMEWFAAIASVVP